MLSLPFRNQAVTFMRCTPTPKRVSRKPPERPAGQTNNESAVEKTRRRRPATGVVTALSTISRCTFCTCSMATSPGRNWNGTTFGSVTSMQFTPQLPMPSGSRLAVSTGTTMEYISASFGMYGVDNAATVSPRVAMLPKPCDDSMEMPPSCTSREMDMPTKRASRFNPSRRSLARLERSVAVAKFADAARMTTPSTIEMSSSMRVNPRRTPVPGSDTSGAGRLDDMGDVDDIGDIGDMGDTARVRDIRCAASSYRHDRYS